MNIFLKKFVKKRTKGVSRNNVKGTKTPTRKKVYSKSRKIVKRKNSFSFSSSTYSSIIIFVGLITLSLTIFFLIGNLPVIKNEKLKFLCTYQLGDKGQNYRDAKFN